MTRNLFKYSDCPMHRSMAILGTKWKPIVIYMLRERTARFGQLHASIGSISKKVLTTTLKELEEDGILHREEFKELPPRVEYSLTERGRTLVPIIIQLAKWDNEHYEHNKKNHPAQKEAAV
ncbi:helix-turn-helix transcriptional regulator [Flavobacterium alkalisoli]|uniref:Helix-turn-helix transcriptional regulator n=1 Tax=Flavobacterium alkalisoli TaxID=2602769 RepID=A0A5B9FSB6_9FLAO|nr:helix-turn-helix domain-containing protein [Flavobacterium alkalisoli]QEE49099.1 helix-turn-helix transcriptional regulator [Flavobacterium alkalisoli]